MVVLLVLGLVAGTVVHLASAGGAPVLASLAVLVCLVATARPPTGRLSLLWFLRLALGVSALLVLDGALLAVSPVFLLVKGVFTTMRRAAVLALVLAVLLSLLVLAALLVAVLLALLTLSVLAVLLVLTLTVLAVLLLLTALLVGALPVMALLSMALLLVTLLLVLLMGLLVVPLLLIVLLPAVLLTLPLLTIVVLGALLMVLVLLPLMVLIVLVLTVLLVLAVLLLALLPVALLPPLTAGPVLASAFAELVRVAVAASILSVCVVSIHRITGPGRRYTPLGRRENPCENWRPHWFVIRGLRNERRNR